MTTAKIPGTVIAKAALAIGVAGLLAAPALADNATTAAAIKNMPQGGNVTLSGTVENFDNEHSFMLHDNSGEVKVDLSSAPAIVLKNGENVTVTGVVDNGMLGTMVAAKNVSEDKGVGQQIGQAIDSVTGQDQASRAGNFDIKALPDKGLVRVDGTVDEVSSEKKFTLKDSTGHIGVTIKSGESASLTRGTPVTVVGYVGKSFWGNKMINATEVDVHSTASD